MAGNGFQAVERDLDAIGPAADALRASLRGVLDEEGLACVELAVVEALTNSIMFAPQAAAGPIQLFLEISDSDVVVEIEDGSPPMPGLFDGAGAERLDFDPEDRQSIPESGRGLSLIVLSMHEVGYRIVGDRSRLRMVRHRA